MIIIAHDIRSLHNVGSIFRNAAAFNVEKLYLTGFTETPPRKEIAKVALGAELLVDWAKTDVTAAIDECRQAGYTVLGLETGEEAVDIALIDEARIALVLGNEVAGIDAETRQLLDGLVVIPMGKKQSLNVSVASGIAMYVLTKK
ncbi:TPA: RNA methyltransferase [Candidatus Uhrbacteria bacterium]|nr:RNA methyltransferase [Candidatus Uhrbacteria bacterium]